jgi:hypothetical protein
MAIEINKTKFGIEFPRSYSKATRINANGNGGDFSVEIQVKTWKDKETKDGTQKTVKDEDGNDVTITIPGEPFQDEHFIPYITKENKEDLDIIRAAAYRMLHREEQFAKGKKV